MITSMSLKSLDVSMTGITAALYIVLGYLFQPISFFEIQFRIAEVIVGMCILFPIPGLIGKIIGVFFVNMTSPFVPLDFISCIVNIPALYCIILFKKLGKDGKLIRYIGGIFYALFISVYVAWLIGYWYSLPIELFPLNFLYVFISEVILATLGIYIFSIIEKRVYFQGDRPSQD